VEHKYFYVVTHALKGHRRAATLLALYTESESIEFSEMRIHLLA
jgi:hypothetical protein